MAKKRLIENVLSLSSVQFVGYLLPLLTVPYLVRVLGPEKFGLIAFAQAFILYFSYFTDYGFNYSAPREISIHREDREHVNDIVMAVMLVKLAITAAGFCVFCALVFGIGRFRQHWALYLLSFGGVLGNVLLPTWFFQGIERIKHIAFLNATVKVFFTATIFLFIRSADDYLLVPLLNSLGFILAGLIGLVLMRVRFHIRARFPTRTVLNHELREGWTIFVSVLTINLYSASGIFILGLFAPAAVVGYYSAADKIVKALHGLLIWPLSQTIYPHIGKLSAQSHDAGLSFARRVIRIVAPVTFAISTVLFLFAGPVGHLIFGRQFIPSITILRILAFLPFIMGISNILGVQIMLNYGLRKTFARIILVASLLNLALSFSLVVPFQQVGIAVAVLITEVFVTLRMCIALERNRLSIFPFRIPFVAVRS